MKMVIAAIYDAKAEAWLTPMYFQGEGQALRSFGDVCEDSNTDFGRHPEDFTLFKLGEFDQRSGQISVEDAAVPLVKGIHVIQRSE